MYPRDPQPYHTSALSDEAWVVELLTGHPECIWCELGVHAHVFANACSDGDLAEDEEVVDAVVGEEEVPNEMNHLRNHIAEAMCYHCTRPYSFSAFFTLYTT
ncbi:hypothetical protein BDR07DRAFT_1572002 [Suillus spraguei]|nr:hypothetical protein BDR07DRAFT_1572002 [Suillus spraguei]